MKQKSIINITIIITSITIIFVSIIWSYYYEVPIGTVYVHGRVTTNSTVIPYGILFGMHDGGSKTVEIEDDGSYSIILPNNHSYSVMVFSNYKVPHVYPKFYSPTAASVAGPMCLDISLDLNTSSTQLEYNVSCITR